jgi:hypothetical protein
MELRPGVLAAIASTAKAHPSASIWITGHSLGGSLAELSAVDASLELNRTVNLYSFGTPRVGNDAWAALVEQVLAVRFRVTHRQDLIPLYPPRSAGYQHPTTEVWFDNDSGVLLRTVCLFVSLVRSLLCATSDRISRVQHDRWRRQIMHRRHRSSGHPQPLAIPRPSHHQLRCGSLHLGTQQPNKNRPKL